jgi:hypothetical protein
LLTRRRANVFAGRKGQKGEGWRGKKGRRVVRWVGRKFGEVL